MAVLHKILLNCHHKLRSDIQLKQLIESYEENDIKFDVDTAIKVLRKANFQESATYLAKKHRKHDIFFEIQAENDDKIDAALDYMDEMDDPDEIATYLNKYGKLFIKVAPDKTIKVIQTLCLGRDDLQPSLRNFGSIPRQICPGEFYHIFGYNVDLFIRLLEQLVDSDTDSIPKSAYNLLLELYIITWRKEKNDLSKNFYAEKINELLSQPPGKLDLNQALILSRNNRFDDGLTWLYARANLYHLVLQYHIDQDDSLKIMKTCDEFGSKDPRLFMPALQHYSMNGDERLGQLLKTIEHQKAIAPMIVIEILLDSKRSTLASAKEYLMRYLGRLNDRHLENVSSIDRYEVDTKTIRQKIDEFQNHHLIFQPTKCQACSGVLDIPSVHFLCGHSYHQNCFYNHSEGNDECPSCAKTNQMLLDEIGSHEMSKSSLDDAENQAIMPGDDVFASTSRFFGYGLDKIEQ